MKRALGEFCIEGIKSTIPFHQRVMEDEDFIQGNFDTHFLERYE
jgi:acetyl-CoA carboxylase biotin carboxylase subunit